LETLNRHSDISLTPVQTEQSYNTEIARITAASKRREHLEHTARYSAFDRPNLLRVQKLERQILRLLDCHNFDSIHSKKILEIGCGTGHWLTKLVDWGASPANLTGVDIQREKIVEAGGRCPAGVRLECHDATRLPFSNASFDLVIQFTVFSSILSSGMKAAISSEMLRVLKPDGLVLWYDFFMNNPSNPDVRGIGKREILSLFPDRRIHLRRVTLAPPIGRFLGRISSAAYMAADALGVLSTHYLGLFEKP
jgi:ubiquinone/menaquinone biosynthesis C-methylase UbiE